MMHLFHLLYLWKYLTTSAPQRKSSNNTDNNTQQTTNVSFIICILLYTIYSTSLYSLVQARWSVYLTLTYLQDSPTKQCFCYTWQMRCLRF